MVKLLPFPVAMLLLARVLCGTLQAVVIATFPSTPRLILENNEIDPTPLVIDFDGDGVGDVFMVGYGPNIDFSVATGNRAFILSSPPPNLGGRLQILGTGFPIGLLSGEGIGRRWYEGFNDPATNAYLGIPSNSNFIYFGGSVNDGSGGSVTSFFHNVSGYFGIEFAIGEETHYGWVHVSNEEGLGVGGYIDAWAYETEPGLSILAGAVPEPDCSILLLFGSLLVFERRRKICE